MWIERVVRGLGQRRGLTAQRPRWGGGSGWFTKWGEDESRARRTVVPAEGGSGGGGVMRGLVAACDGV